MTSIGSIRRFKGIGFVCVGGFLLFCYASGILVPKAGMALIAYTPAVGLILLGVTKVIWRW